MAEEEDEVELLEEGLDLFLVDIFRVGAISVREGGRLSKVFLRGKVQCSF